MHIYPELARQQPIFLTQPMTQYFNEIYNPNQTIQLVSLIL